MLCVIQQSSEQNSHLDSVSKVSFIHICFNHRNAETQRE